MTDELKKLAHSRRKGLGVGEGWPPFNTSPERPSKTRTLTWLVEETTKLWPMHDERVTRCARRTCAMCIVLGFFFGLNK